MTPVRLVVSLGKTSETTRQWPYLLPKPWFAAPNGGNILPQSTPVALQMGTRPTRIDSRHISYISPIVSVSSINTSSGWLYTYPSEKYESQLG